MHNTKSPVTALRDAEETLSVDGTTVKLLSGFSAIPLPTLQTPPVWTCPHFVHPQARGHKMLLLLPADQHFSASRGLLCFAYLLKGSVQPDGPLPLSGSELPQLLVKASVLSTLQLEPVLSDSFCISNLACLVLGLNLPKSVFCWSSQKH